MTSLLSHKDSPKTQAVGVSGSPTQLLSAAHNIRPKGKPHFLLRSSHTFRERTLPSYVLCPGSQLFLRSRRLGPHPPLTAQGQSTPGPAWGCPALTQIYTRLPPHCPNAGEPLAPERPGAPAGEGLLVPCDTRPASPAAVLYALRTSPRAGGLRAFPSKAKLGGKSLGPSLGASRALQSDENNAARWPRPRSPLPPAGSAPRGSDGSQRHQPPGTWTCWCFRGNYSS